MINYSNLIEEIKFSNRKLSKEEEKIILKNLDKKTSEIDDFHNCIRCLSLGSNFLSTNKEIINRFFSEDLEDYNMQGLLYGIRYSNLTEYYITEIKDIVSYENYIDNDYSVQTALGNIAIHSNEKNGKEDKKFLITKFNEALNLEVNDSYSLNNYIVECYESLLHAFYGKGFRKKFGIMIEYKDIDFDLIKSLSNRLM